MNAQFLGCTIRESILWGAVGYVAGHLAQTSPEQVAAVFAISQIANSLFCLFNYYTTEDKATPEGKKSLHFTNKVTSVINGCVTAVVLQRMQLMSKDGAFLLAWGSIVMNIIIPAMN